MSSERRRITTNGISLDVGLAGPPEGPPVVLLHGFPEPGRCWRHQVPALAAAGWRVIVPDQRGYAKSDKPAGVAAYSIDTLVDDIRGLLRSLGHESAAWVGHDWGGAITWWAAQHHPTSVRRFAVLNCPHPSVLARAVRTDPEQRKRSWYMGAFQVPGVPEWALRRNDFSALTRSMVKTSNPGTFPPEELAAYREAWAEPGALTGMLNWYRAGRRLFWQQDDAPITPTGLLLWGRKDHALRDTLAAPSVALCQDAKLQFLDDAGHWIEHEAAERVNAALVSFLGPASSGAVGQ